jgi:hypothetical protein
VSDFQKKLFRGAKIEDLILDLELLNKEYEDTIKKTEDIDRKRFYEGMAVAFKIVSMKLKGEFEYMEQEVLDRVYESIVKLDNKKSDRPKRENLSNTKTCSFCGRDQNVVKYLIPGPGVSICENCLEFGRKIIETKERKITDQ